MAYINHDCVPNILHGDIKYLNIFFALFYEPYLQHKCVPSILHTLTIAIESKWQVCMLGKNAPQCLFWLTYLKYFLAPYILLQTTRLYSSRSTRPCSTVRLWRLLEMGLEGRITNKDVCKAILGAWVDMVATPSMGLMCLCCRFWRPAWRGIIITILINMSLKLARQDYIVGQR